MSVSKKIYIIGTIPKKIDNKCIDKFSETGAVLKKAGFDAINPLERLLKIKSATTARKKNLRDLLASDAVYIIPDSQFNEVPNLELTIALSINLTIISGIL